MTSLVTAPVSLIQTISKKKNGTLSCVSLYIDPETSIMFFFFYKIHPFLLSFKFFFFVGESHL